MRRWIFVAALGLLASAAPARAQQGPTGPFSYLGTSNQVPWAWGSAEYLLWWVRPNTLSTPLVTTTTDPLATVNGANVAAGLGRPGTNILLGGSDIGYGALSGGRFTVGTWMEE